MKDKCLMLGLLLCTLASNASAQQQNSNPLGQIFSQLGAGQSGSPLLMKPAGTNPSATLNVMFFIKKSPVMVNVCEFYAQIHNPSNVHVDLGQMPVTYKNK
ncbi:MAG: hypothetical protein NVV74_24175 [Magnetospirillum sp.]|nr:hypothetical protein [Magnetospirillum sp.]